MRASPVLCLVLFAAGLAAAPARAQTGGLPTFAQTPPPAAPDSPWKGLSVGAEAFWIGGRGAKGGFGGATNVAWSRTFDNNVILGLKLRAGYAPALAFAPLWGGRRAGGWNFVETSATVGYDFGRVRPWASVGAAFLKPTGQRGFGGGIDTLNAFFEPGGGTRGLVTYGAGADIAITNNVTLGVAVHGVTRQ
jgi:opacity protein-like surface antigen